MFVKIPTDFPREVLAEFCESWGTPLQRVDEFASFPDWLPIIAVCELATQNGYVIGHTELGSLKFEPMKNPEKRPPVKPLTREQIRRLKKQRSPGQVHRDLKQAERELADADTLSQAEIDCLLSREPMPNG
ncbi:hypothetical protein [uncultured Paraglaciecola sp.]|uniref:hypothetical protein n=1 Tax=uncultured Paraglaciecola sp. TaxID=1765024 RepID=UPI00261F00F8|nr:hypothetical protein [uncultured Paraglaciecola sp.]